MSDSAVVDASKEQNIDKSHPVVNPYSSSKTKYYTLGLLTVVYTFNFIDRQLLAILQESIKIDLTLSDFQLGLMTGPAFAFFYVTMGIPMARWADRANRRNVIAISIGLWSFMTAISGAAQNFAHLALARVGVGIGEAGGSPPSHSILSDIFPPEQRASAISFYSTGVSFGILFGFLFGGWLNEFFGWRVAFVAVGLPGILIAVLIRVTMKEPLRGLLENKQGAARSSLIEVVSVLCTRRSFIFLALASGLNAFAGYGGVNWQASFFIRSHGMSTGELGTYLALISGACGAIGVFGGGLLADKLAPRDKRWYVWLPAITGFICVPFIAYTYIASDPYVGLLSAVVPGILFNVYLGNAIATSHGLVGLRMRATASAILFLVINVIGLLLSSPVIGILSDYLSADYGVESLRHTLTILLPTAMFLSACCFYLASHNLREDLQRAPS